MKKVLALIMVAFMLSSLVACADETAPTISETDNNSASSNDTVESTEPTSSNDEMTVNSSADTTESNTISSPNVEITSQAHTPTKPAATKAPTKPAATKAPTKAPVASPTPALEPGEIAIQAELPSDFKLDFEDIFDVNNVPMFHSYRQDELAADGLHYIPRSSAVIKFAAYDWYEYTVTTTKAGTYKLYVYASGDRPHPVTYTVNDGSATIGIFERIHFNDGNYEGYTKSELGTVNLIEGENKLKFTIEEQKNHNMWTDYYILAPVS